MIPRATRSIVSLAVLATIGLAAPAGAQFPEPITGFETDRDGNVLDAQCASLGPLGVVMFEDPAQDGTTSAFIVPDFGSCSGPVGGWILPSTEESAVMGFDGFQDADGTNLGQFMDMRFEWVDPSNTTRWALVTAVGPLRFGSASLDLDGIVRMEVNLPDCAQFEFPGLTPPSRVYVALLIMETGTDLPQGFLDTAGSGRMEFVGVSSVTDANTANPFPVPTTFVDVTDSDCDGTDAGDWVTLTFDLAAIELAGEVIGWDFEGGDGTLDAADLGVNRGMLAGLVLGVDAADTTSDYLEFLVDNVEFEATMQDPTIAPRLGSPIIEFDTSVRVNGVLSSATDVTLEIDRVGARGGFVADDTCSVNPGGAVFVDIDFTTDCGGLAALAVGDQLRAKQTNPSGTSAYSTIITVNPPARFSITLELDEAGPDGTELEFIGATVAGPPPQGKPAFGMDGVWQDFDFFFDGRDPILNFFQGDNQLVPDGGLWNISAIWMTIDTTDPQVGPYEILIDGVEIINADTSTTPLVDTEGTNNAWACVRGQSSVQVADGALPLTDGEFITEITSDGSSVGTAAARLQWLFATTGFSETSVPLQRTQGCGAGTTSFFIDSATGIRLRMEIRGPAQNLVLARPVVEPITGDAAMVTVSGLDPTANDVQLYIDGVAGASIDPAGAASVDIDPGVVLAPGMSVAATQTTAADGVSDLSHPRSPSAPPAPSVQSPLVEGQTSVTVSGILNAANATADLVTLLIDGVEVLPATDPAGASSVNISVSPALVAGQQITATQRVNALVSAESPPVGVGTGETVCVVINEFTYDDSLGDDREYVELYNADVVPVDISNWTLRASDTEAPPNDNNPDYVIPAATVLASGDYYVLGAATVANVDLVVGVSDLWENANEALELLDQNGVVVDTVIYELNKGPVAVSPAEGGVYANHRSNDGLDNSWSRWFDGLDTDNNGADFGVLPATPGSTNTPASLAPLADNFDAGGVGGAVTNWLGSFVNAIYIDPTTPDGNNPNAIVDSSGAGGSGNQAGIYWDPAGGGNTVVLVDEARYGVSFTCLVYIDTSSNGFTAGITSGEFEQWDIGLGTAGTFYNTGLGSTGLTWKYRRTEDLDTGTLGSVVLDLVNENDAGPDETVLFSVPGGSLTTGWHTLTLTRNYENYSAAFDSDATAGVLAGNGPSAMYVGYQEFLVTNTLGRPPTIDDLSITIPAAPTLGACCTECDCTELTDAECTAIGGAYIGDGTDCADSDTNGLPDQCEGFVPPAPTVSAPLCDGGMVVTVTGLAPESSEVTVLEGGANPIGSASTGGAASAVVLVSPTLADGDSITAIQTAGGIDSPASAVVLVGVCPPTDDCVVINELVYDDAGTDDREYVELYNPGPGPVDLGNWILRASDTVAPPGDNNADYGIPAGTVLAAGDYYVIGNCSTVANCDLDVGTTDLWENANEAIELLDGNGGVVDSVITELNKGPVAVSPAEGGIYGNFRSEDLPAPPQSLSRWFDGLDTDDNGRDFGVFPISPGTSNEPAPLAKPFTENFDVGAVDTAVTNWTGAFEGLRYVDPTAVGTANPSVIVASPQGGQAATMWDQSGGGDMAALIDEARFNVAFTCEVYIDVASSFTALNTTGEAEQWSIGLGMTDTFYNIDNQFPNTNGNTGLAWTFNKTEDADTGNVGSVTLELIDYGNGGPAAEHTLLFSVPGGSLTTGWHNLTLSRNYDGYSAAFDADNTNGSLAGNGPSTIYVGYREFVVDNSLVRPFTVDNLQITVPAAPTLGACCLECDCLELTAADCTAIAGAHQGDGTDCSDTDTNGVADACEAVVPPNATGWQSCALHDPAGDQGPPTTWCMDLVEAPPRVGPPDPRTDTQIEPRFYGTGGTAQAFLEVMIALDGAATGAVTVDAVCTDTSTHGATVTVSSDGLTVTAIFDPPLPNTECCTMTLGGGAGGSQVIKLLQGDVNGSGRVNATDKNIVKGKITTQSPPLFGDDFFYDVNMSGRINATDKNLVKGRISTANELDPLCP